MKIHKQAGRISRSKGRATLQALKYTARGQKIKQFPCVEKEKIIQIERHSPQRDEEIDGSHARSLGRAWRGQERCRSREAIAKGS